MTTSHTKTISFDELKRVTFKEFDEIFSDSDCQVFVELMRHSIVTSIWNQLNDAAKASSQP